MIRNSFLFFTFLFFIMCSQTAEQKIDSMMKDYQGNVPGASLLVIKNGKKIINKQYGLSNLESGQPIVSASNFRLASITKQFTAFSILQLIDQNKLSLENTITDIYPDFPEHGSEITIRHILQHSSGLIDYEDLIPDSVTQQVYDRDVLQMMKEQDSTYFEPGLKYKYSNTGYAVLAQIIERLSGKTFPEYLEENIFKPIGMNNSVAFVYGVNQIPNRTFGYVLTDSGFVFKDQSMTSAVLGDGGIYSSVEDLYKWDQALYKSMIISDSLKQKAWTAEQLPGDSVNTYGFGWRIDTLDGHWRMHHNGSTSGFRNTIQRYPDDSLTVIILTNRAEPDVFDIAENIAKMYLEYNNPDR